MKRLLLAVSCASLAACATPAKQADTNPFARSLQTSGLRKLTLALVLPELKATKKGSPSKDTRLERRSGEEPEKLYRDLLPIYYQHFKRVTLLRSLTDSRASQADIAAKVAIGVEVKPESLVLTSTFYSPENSVVATVRNEAKGSSRLLAKKPEDVFAALLPTLIENLDDSLAGSAELQQYARGSQVRPAGEQAAGEQDRVRAFDSDVDRPAYKLPENSANFAVVIGIEKYQNLPAAEFASRDALTVRAHLRALGYPGENIITLADSQATGSAMKSYLESWLARRVTTESKVFVYFSGHGAPDVESKQAYLVPWDGDPQFLADTGYSLKRFYKTLNSLKAREIVVAMDSCFSGAGGKSVLSKGARPLVLKIDAAGGGELGKVTVLAASGGDEITASEESQGHGLFTYYLLKGLNESSGSRTVSQLYENLKPQVEAAARRANRSQTPQLLGAEPSAATTLR